MIALAGTAVTAPEWRDCADPDELAAAVAAGVEVLAMGRAGDFPTANQTADQFAGSLRAGITYRIPTSWSPEPPAPDEVVAPDDDLRERTLAQVATGSAAWSAVRRHLTQFEPITSAADMDALASEIADAVLAVLPTPLPVPPWPGAVLSGLVDEDGVPTWLAQAGQVRGEQVRACTSVPWLPNTSYGEDEWVEVRAPRAVPEPETERVDALKVLRDRSYRVVWMKDHAAPACSIGPWNDDVAVWSAAECRGYVQPIAPDGTVEVLKDGGQ